MMAIVSVFLLRAREVRERNHMSMMFLLQENQHQIIQRGTCSDGRQELAVAVSIWRDGQKGRTNIWNNDNY